MCRLLGLVSKVATTVADGVGDDFSQFTNLSCYEHGDGWGVALRNGEEFIFDKCEKVAFGDSDFARLTQMALCDSAIVHLRWATLALAVTYENTHPFNGFGASFAHNGSIQGTEGFFSYFDQSHILEGDTDSERYFHLVAALGRNEDGSISFTDGIQRAIALIEEEYEYSSLNAMCLTEESLFVVSYHDKTKIDHRFSQDYYDLSFRRSETNVVVASSGWPQDGWEVIPNYTLVAIDRRTLEMTFTPLGVTDSVSVGG
ncbi:MAG: class II glutamine amidotransferase [Actinomycetota bacterium]|nr:class II glutamine amidotransferase [Actinomycetota bacterium]